MRRFLSIILCFLCCFTVGCQLPSGSQSESSSVVETPQTQQVLSVSTSDTTLIKGDTFTINYYIAVEETVVFSSNNESVCTVDGNGKVTAVGVGNAMISIQVGELIRFKKFTVVASTTYCVKIYDGDIIMLEEGTFSLDASLVKGMVKYPDKCTYSIDDTKIATIDGSGNIKALKQGSCTITVSCEKDGRTYFETVALTVAPAVYIDCVDEIDCNFSEPQRFEYVIKKISDDTPLENAVAKITMDNATLFEISGNVLTGVELGETKIRLQYAGVEKVIDAACRLGVAEDEYNFFTHEQSIKGVFTTGTFNYRDLAQKANEGYYSPVSITRTVNGEDMGMNCLHITNRAKNGTALTYLGLYMESRKTYEEMVALQSKGYEYIQFEIFTIMDPADYNKDGVIDLAYDPRPRIETSYQGSPLFNVRINCYKWQVVKIPLSAYLDNYFTVHSGKDETQIIRTTLKSGEFFSMYIKPVKFVKE